MKNDYFFKIENVDELIKILHEKGKVYISRLGWLYTTEMSKKSPISGKIDQYKRIGFKAFNSLKNKINNR